MYSCVRFGKQRSVVELKVLVITRCFTRPKRKTLLVNHLMNGVRFSRCCNGRFLMQDLVKRECSLWKRREVLVLVESWICVMMVLWRLKQSKIRRFHIRSRSRVPVSRSAWSRINETGSSDLEFCIYWCPWSLPSLVELNSNGLPRVSSNSFQLTQCCFTIWKRLIDCIRPEGQEINRAGMSCGSLNSGPSSLGASASTREQFRARRLEWTLRRKTLGLSGTTIDAQEFLPRRGNVCTGRRQWCLV